MQQPRRFQAATLAEAYDAVRRELGESAVILSTRKAFAPGLFGQPGRQFVEVVARIPRASTAAPVRPVFDQDVAAHDLVREMAEATAAGDASRPVSAVEMSEPPREPASLAATSTPLDMTWGRQLNQMQTMLEQLLADRHSARLETGPAPLRSLHERLVRHGMTLALAASVIAEVDPVHTHDESALLAAATRRLAAMLPPVVTLDASRRRTLFLVGPAGAGKTTLAARLALSIERDHGMHPVIASTDVTRAGAPQQLLAIGAATGLDVRLCYGPEELAAILSDPGADLVIVDSPGHSGARRDRMAELSAMLQVARQRSVLLTVPATMKASALEEAVSAYSGIGIDGLALTRCDETEHLGEVADIAISAAIGLAWTTHSEQVSDPAVPADNASFSAAVVHANWNVVETPVAGAKPTRSRRRLAKVG